MKYFNEELKNKSDIPFDSIDEEMHDLIYAFNYIGLITKFCCSGHGNSKTYIMLDDTIDSKNDEVIIKVINCCDNLSFNYWVRSAYEYGIMKNWVWGEYFYGDYIYYIDDITKSIIKEFNIPTNDE